MGVTMESARTSERTWLWWTGWASLLGNCLLVVTGGAVRLTGSGLGCPTWPKCYHGALTPRHELNIHSAIEFGNRTLTFLLAAIAVVTFVVAWRSGRRELRWLAFGLGMFIPAQAVIGGITVLTDLEPSQGPSRSLGAQTRGISSAGRAPALQAGCHRFDPGILHLRARPADRSATSEDS